MREIKFRAWDKKAKCWMRPDESGLLFLNFEVSNKGIFYIHDESNTGHDDYELMQYTGLKDKNGKEVYEDDVLFIKKWGSHKNIVGVMEYCEHMGHYEISNEVYPVPAINTREAEIIGNIYEHPELIK